MYPQHSLNINCTHTTLNSGCRHASNVKGQKLALGLSLSLELTSLACLAAQ